MMNSSIADILQHLVKELSTWAEVRNGRVALAGDPAHAVELLTAGRPGGIAVVIYYSGDSTEGSGELPEDTMVKATIKVAVVRSRGLETRPATEIAPAVADADALRAYMSCLEAAGTLTGVYEYMGMEPLQGAAGEFLAGYVQTWSALYAHTVGE